MAAPEATTYAQDARPYAIVTMLATVATYLLVRALADGRWRWWAGYGAALAPAGLFNLFSLLLIVAHGLSLLAPGGRAAAARPPGDSSARWTAAATAVNGRPHAAAGGGLPPAHPDRLADPARLAYGHVLAAGFAGSRAALVPVALLALAGAPAGLAPRSAAGLTPGLIALPWLAAPALILLAASQAHPLYTGRYVEFSQPALPLLCAAGLSWLAGMTARLPQAAPGEPCGMAAIRRDHGHPCGVPGGPQQAVRRQAPGWTTSIARQRSWPATSTPATPCSTSPPAGGS